MNHVFVDFENVHKVDEGILSQPEVHLTLLMGANQTKLDASLVEKLLMRAGSVQLVRLGASGRNALDFVLAYYVGRAVMSHPLGCIHIISKDTGFDPLIAHLRSRQISAHRHEDFSTLTVGGKSVAKPSVAATKKVAAKKPSAEKPPAEKPPEAKLAVGSEEKVIQVVLDRLRKSAQGRPKRKLTLLRHLQSGLGKEATPEMAELLLAKLTESGHVILDEKEAVTYQL
jgi:hypothetical protein